MVSHIPKRADFAAVSGPTNSWGCYLLTGGGGEFPKIGEES